MKFDEAGTERLCLAGFLHNLGVFGLPEELLLSADRLNPVAKYQVAEHPIPGERVLGATPEYEEMSTAVRWHHERPDGQVYPGKLRGPWIPLEAKILTVAQAYAATVLDGMVVRAFLRILDTETEGYRMAGDQRFAFPDQEARGHHSSGGTLGSVPAAR